jgi:predicted amidohydrolase
LQRNDIRLASQHHIMRVTLLQTDITWASPDANRENVNGLLASNEGSDLYVLPEMWTTGFATVPEGIAESEGKSLEWMKAKAQEMGAALSGSVATAVTTGDGKTSYFNRHYFVRPDGSYHIYDKRHLFGYGGEDKYYDRGNERVTVDYKGWRWLLLTCYDLRFPVWSRNRMDYDGIIIVANWPTSRRRVWDILLRARAIENQCVVLAANRVGADQRCLYDGGSMVVDARGRVIGSCEDGKQGACTAEISLTDLRQFRQKFDVLRDRDEFDL